MAPLISVTVLRQMYLHNIDGNTIVNVLPEYKLQVVRTVNSGHFLNRSPLFQISLPPNVYHSIFLTLTLPLNFCSWITGPWRSLRGWTPNLLGLLWKWACAHMEAWTSSICRLSGITVVSMGVRRNLWYTHFPSTSCFLGFLSHTHPPIFPISKDNSQVFYNTNLIFYYPLSLLGTALCLNKSMYHSFFFLPTLRGQ